MSSLKLLLGKSLIALTIGIILLAPIVSTQSFASSDNGARKEIDVMSQNLYTGADFAPVITAQNQAELLAAVSATYDAIQSTDFNERARAIAREVERAEPDVIGLQEAVIIRTQVPADGPAIPATTVAYDYLQILIDELAARNLHYVPIIEQAGFDVELPGLFATGLKDVRITDRVVMLVRSDLVSAIRQTQGGQFSAALSTMTPFGTLMAPQAWVLADIQLGKGEKIRLISTHLEATSPEIQTLQANELLSGPARTKLPVIMFGDFNANALSSGSQTYLRLIKEGKFVDAWKKEGKGSGLTCCQNDDLRNSKSTFSKRIDLILYRGSFDVTRIDVVGDTNREKTTTGLWPSNHGGLISELKLRSH